VLTVIVSTLGTLTVLDTVGRVQPEMYAEIPDSTQTTRGQVVLEIAKPAPTITGNVILKLAPPVN